MIWVVVLLVWSASPLLVFATDRACHFAAEWLIPLTSEPPKMTFTVLVCCGGSGGVTSLSTWFCRSLCCNVLLPLSVRRSFRWLRLRSCDFKFEGIAIFGSMSMVAMKVTPLWGILFVARSYHLARPSNRIAHVPEYRHEFCWRNTEVVLWHYPVFMRTWWSIERTTNVSFLFTTSTNQWVRIYVHVCSLPLYPVTSLRLLQAYLDGYPALASSSSHLIWAHALAKTSSIVLQGYLVSSL